MNKINKKKKKLRRRTTFTILAMLNIVWYTIIVLIASFLDHTVPSELTIAWFAAWTTELALLYGIKVHDKYTDPDYIDNNMISRIDEEPLEDETIQDEQNDLNDINNEIEPQDESTVEDSDIE